MQRWHGSEVRLKWGPVLAALLALVVANFFQALGWSRLLERMTGKQLRATPVLSVFMLSQMARYAPGKVGVPMVRIAAASRLGVDPRLVAASVGIEVGTWMGLGAIMSCIALLCSHGAAPNWLHLSRLGLVLTLVAMLVGLGATMLIDRRQFPHFILRLLRADGQGSFVSWRMVWVQLLSWGCWWVFGVLMPLAVGATWTTSVGYASVFIIAPIIGFLALVAPGGLGVRETVISYALAPKLGASAALAAALLARGVVVVSELIGWLLALVWERCNRAR